MSEQVKRYDAVHLRYEDSNIRYGEGCEVEVVTASDYAALAAENARLGALVSDAIDSSLKILVANKRLVDESDALHAEAEALRDCTKRIDAYWQSELRDCRNERDALAAELAIARRVIDRIGQLCTTPHESKERFIRRVQSVIEWQTAAQQDQPK